MKRFHCPACGKEFRVNAERCSFTAWKRCPACNEQVYEEDHCRGHRSIDWSNSKEFNFDKETISGIQRKQLRMAENYPDSPLNDAKLHRDMGVTKKQYAAMMQREMVDNPNHQRRFTEAELRG